MTTKSPSVFALLTDGMPATVASVKVLSKKTKPPVPYTEGTLLDDMRAAGKFVEDPALRQILKEVAGIGTAATRDAAIEGLKSDKYIEKSGKHLKSLPKGQVLVEWLEVAAPVLVDVATTAQWEAQLAAVAAKGGGMAFELQVAKQVRDLVATLKAAPPLALAGKPSTPGVSRSTHTSETSRMSDSAASAPERTGPTPKMLEFATSIASRLGKDLPGEVRDSFEACSKFIEDNKAAAIGPSPKQLSFADSIAKRKSLEIPASARADGRELSRWIDANK